MLKETFKKKFIKYFLVLVMLIILHYIGILKLVENKIIEFLNPFFSYSHSLSTDVKSKYIDQIKKIDLVEEIKKIEIENRELLIENIKLEKLEEENKILREQLRFLKLNEYNYEMANVISRGESVNTINRIETIIIDKGKANGLFNGLAVLGDKGVLIGKIIDAQENISKVYLTNNKKCNFAAQVFHKRNATGIVEGNLGLTIEMKFIPQDVAINFDDLIISSGLEKEIPDGLMIGKVINVERENNELWQKATLEPMIDYSNLSIVSVLIP